MRLFSARSKVLPIVLFLLGTASTLHAATLPSVIPGYVIVPLGRGHTNRYCLAATIDGRKGLAILDTGANLTALSEATYHGLLAKGGNLPPHMPKRISLNGSSVPLVLAPDLVVANVNLGSFPVPLVPRRYLYNAAIGAAEDRTYDLLLGEEFLRHFRALVDCGRLALYLNVDPAKHLALTSALLAGGWTRVPMTDLKNDFTVPCSFNGHSFRLIVDTGAGFSVLDRGQVSAMGLRTRDIPGFTGGLVGTVAKPAGIVTIDGLHIGGYVAPTAHLQVTEQSFGMFAPTHEQSQEGTIAGLLGPDLLSANDAIVDVGNKALYLKHR